MAEKPKASSTPKIVDVSRRRPIGDLNDESVQSPININNMIPEGMGRRRSHYDSNSEDEKSDTNLESFESNDKTEEDTNNEQEYVTNITFCNCINPLYIVGLIVLSFSMIWLYSCGDGSVKEGPSLKQLSQDFPSQVEDFWLSIEVGIQEITKFGQPKTFLFLYTDESEKTMYTLLYKVSQFAVCALSNCSEVPVVLEGNDLNTTYILEDYGRIIEGNKQKLKESGVMIVKNLERIPGVSAQAFHSFCDEYNPVVKNALLIFTMKVDKFHNNNVNAVENYLRKLWDDLEDDTFYALLTRISSNVLPIMVER